MEVSIESFELPRLSFYLSLKLTILSKVPGSYIMFLESLIVEATNWKEDRDDESYPWNLRQETNP